MRNSHLLPVTVALFLSICLCRLRAANISTDEEALLAFKARITSDPQNRLLSSWTRATPVCNWIGVTCGVRHGRVDTIQLSNMSLKGTIPPHIGNLSFLINFSVSTNQFHGHLPAQFAKLHRLKWLDLRRNLFSGIIPSWIGSLTRLEYLNLRSNNFEDVIPPSLGNLSRLQRLYLYENRLEGRIPDTIGNLNNLKSLYLSYNKLSGAIPFSISNISSLQYLNVIDNSLSGSIEMFSNSSMPSLRILDLSYNNLTGGLPPLISTDFPALEELYLSFNSFEGTIPSSLFGCKHLQIISLSFNKFEGGMHEDFGNLTMLREIYLGHNHFQGEIPSSIGNLINLERLSVIRNSIGGKIPSSIGNLTQLQSLDCGENNLTGNIPMSFGNLVSLEGLYLGTNNLEGLLPSTIYNISTLKVLGLEDNYHLSGSFPSDFGLNLPHLEEISVGGNNFHGPIPVSLSNCSKLTDIDFSSNILVGLIPNSLGDLRNLKGVRLWNNNLGTQSLSNLLLSFANCRNLTTLALGDNPLNSTMPISIGNLSSSLQKFSLGDCGLTGSIPLDIGNLSSLIALNFRGNMLKGFIPTTIAKLRKLQGFTLESNRLQGSIPSELCFSKNLVTIVLADNELSGNVPSCIGRLNSLRNLYLGSNKLNSSIPLSLWELKDILLLNLSSNSLSGILPLDIGKLKAITLLDLSGNQLSGNIPPTFGRMQSLTNLSLSNNRFKGLIPDSLSEAVSLEFIDLSMNNLSGEIPKSFEKLKYLKEFNMSFNELEGEIPNEGPFRNMSANSFLGNKGLCGAPKFRVRECKLKGRNESRTKKIAILVATGTTVLALGTIIGILIWCWRRKKRLSTSHPAHVLPLSTLQRISIHELKRATNDFDELNMLGRGSFGSVYRGTLLDGSSIAVKVYNMDFEGALKSFEMECEFLRNIRHKNLVKVITSCCTTEFKALIMEFMPKLSLDKWLYSHNCYLNLLQRLDIMIDVASAIEYLHHGSTQAIVHCDLKPNNILLDDDMVAHVTDFGISKLIGEGQSFIQTMTLATVGYMAPEYGLEGLVSVKGDVYSFGILMMEILARRKPTDEMFNDEMDMKKWVKDSLAQGVTHVADPNLLRANEPHYLAKAHCIASVMELALMCCADLAEERIDSKDVHNALDNIKKKFVEGCSTELKIT